MDTGIVGRDSSEKIITGIENSRIWENLQYWGVFLLTFSDHKDHASIGSSEHADIQYLLE